MLFQLKIRTNTRSAPCQIFLENLHMCGEIRTSGGTGCCRRTDNMRHPPVIHNFNTQKGRKREREPVQVVQVVAEQSTLNSMCMQCDQCYQEYDFGRKHTAFWQVVRLYSPMLAHTQNIRLYSTTVQLSGQKYCFCFSALKTYFLKLSWLKV